MEDTPFGASFGSARAQGGPFPFPGVPTTPPEQVEFTDEQKRELANAMHEAEVAILRAIARSASHADPGYAARGTARLTYALATLRLAAGQARAGTPFFPGPPPWAMGPESMEDFGAP